jgi:hypothetical protein
MKGGIKMSWNKLSLAIAALSMVLLPSCANIGVTTIKASSPKPENCILDIYTDEREIKRPFEVLCLIDSTTARSVLATKTGAAALEKAKPEACKCGADAILITEIGKMATMDAQGKAVLKAIRYTDR